LSKNKYFQFTQGIKILDEKMSFYLFISILCAKILGVNWALGSLHTRHFCSRYCDKKTFFIQYFFSCVYWKYFFRTILNILKCHYNILKKRNIFIKMSSYLFIKILCAKMFSVYKALISEYNLNLRWPNIPCDCDWIYT